jgi:hypothetical protein
VCRERVAARVAWRAKMNAMSENSWGSITGLTSWAVGRWWHRRGAFAITLAAAGVALAFTAHRGTTAWHSLKAIQAQPTSSDLKPAPVTPGPAVAPLATDFTDTLAVFVSASDAMAIVHDAARRANVSVESTQARVQSATTVRLGHNDLSVAARGEYTAVKRWLGETMSRLPSATVSGLQLQRAAGANDLELRATLRVWSKPVAATEDR